jgi:hypothetical protein
VNTRVSLPDGADVNPMQFNFALLDGFRGLHISVSTVSNSGIGWTDSQFKASPDTKIFYFEV